ncbi:MAG: hypothetical protein JJE34_06075 [Alphaproteobacteria bacterium]|nr:hypothetical protein [Alphaproteobacteria bacterium]
MTAGPALAQTGPYYRAELTQPVAAKQIVEKGLLWSCSTQTCLAGESNSRDTIVCSALVRKLGPVNAFSANGKYFDEKKLADCNSRVS